MRRPGPLLKGFLLLVACVLPLGGCRWRQAGGAPSVEFGGVPPAGQGGAERPDDIEDELPKVGGRVVAAAFAPGSVLLWMKGWFLAAAGVTLALALLALYRYRLRRLTRRLNLRFEERLAERTRIAQEIHDTFLQDVLGVSMQLHVVVDGLPEDSPAREPLGHIQALLGRIIEEGRNTLKGLRPDGGAAPELAEAFSQVAGEFGHAERIDYRVTAEGETGDVKRDQSPSPPFS